MLRPEVGKVVAIRLSDVTIHANRAWGAADVRIDSLVVTRADVFAIRDGQETLCALMQQTIMVMHGKGEK